MARTFIQANGEYLASAFSLVTAAPCTLACWQNMTAGDGSSQCLVEIADNSGVSDDHIALYHDGNDTIDAEVVAGISQPFKQMTCQGYGVLEHVAAVFTPTTLQPYCNGRAGSAGATLAPSFPAPILSVGRWHRHTTDTNFASGLIAEVAVWDIALSWTDIALLSYAHNGYLGYSPLLIQRDHLKHYYRLIGVGATEADEVGGYPLTAVGTAQGAHPNIDYAGPLAPPFMAQLTGSGIAF